MSTMKATALCGRLAVRRLNATQREYFRERLSASKRSFYRCPPPFRDLRPPRPAHLRNKPYPAPRFR